jgi:predicted translin family RNA/ssDNA-binding protein
LLGHFVGGDAGALAVGKTSEFIGGVVDVVGNTGRTLFTNLRRKPKGGNKMA